MTELDYMEEYHDYFSKIEEVAANSLACIVSKELEKERADSPIKNKKRQMMTKMLPHLEILSLGSIVNLINVIENKG